MCMRLLLYLDGRNVGEICSAARLFLVLGSGVFDVEKGLI